MLNVSPLIKGYAVRFIVFLCCIGLSTAHAAADIDDILTRKYPFQQNELERLYQYKLNRGAANLSNASSLLIRASDRALQEGKREEARLYAEYAIKVAPAYPPVYTQWARVCWMQEPYRVDKLCEGLYRYLHAASTHYMPAVFFLSTLLLVFIFAFLLTVAVFTLISLYRYFKLFIHDLGHLLPIPLPIHLSFFCGLFILLLPLIFQWSMVIILYYWLLLLFMYHTRREQQIIIIFTLYLLFAPFLIQILSQLIVTSTKDVFYQVYQVNEDNWDEETKQILGGWLSAHPNDGDALFAMSLINKREGTIEEAQRLYTKLLEVDPLNCRAWCNLGNTLLAAQKPDAAMAHYSRSLELCPESAEGYYNLSRVQLMEYMFPESTKSFNRAKELDPERINQFLTLYADHMNRLVVDQTIPAGTFWQKTFVWTDDKASFAAYLWERFFAGIPYRYRYSVALVCLLFVLLLLTDRSRSRLALACEYCGCAVCKKCKRLVLEHKLCKQCTSIFKGKQDLMISITSKEAQAGAIERFHGRQIVISRLLSLLLPGAGQVLFDYPFKGVAILFLFFFCLVTLLVGDELIVSPLLMMPSYLSIGICCFALAVLYAYSLLDFNRYSIKLAQFLSLIRVTRKEFQIKG